MAYIAVNKDGTELIFNNYPQWNRVEDCWEEEDGDKMDYIDYADFSLGTRWVPNILYGIEVPQGTAKKLVKKELTWKDDPVKI